MRGATAFTVMLYFPDSRFWDLVPTPNGIAQKRPAEIICFWRMKFDPHERSKQRIYTGSCREVFGGIGNRQFTAGYGSCNDIAGM